MNENEIWLYNVQLTAFTKQSNNIILLFNFYHLLIPMGDKRGPGACTPGNLFHQNARKMAYASGMGPTALNSIWYWCINIVSPRKDRSKKELTLNTYCSNLLLNSFFHLQYYRWYSNQVAFTTVTLTSDTHDRCYKLWVLLRTLLPHMESLCNPGGLNRSQEPAYLATYFPNHPCLLSTYYLLNFILVVTVVTF